MMRVVKSAFQAIDESLDEEERDVLADLVEAGDEARRTYTSDEHGQEHAAVVLTGYTAPDGQDRWAVRYTGPEGSEVLDSADRAEAEAAYEAQVKELAGCASEGDAPWWSVTDVPGVPQAAYTVEVEWLRQGQWLGSQAEAHLGRVLSLGEVRCEDRYELTTLQGAAVEIAEAALAQQTETNRFAALAEATGQSWTGDVAQAVWVTVTGTGTGGQETHTEERTIPEYVPTPEEIAAFAA